ncbi:MAG: nucleotidyltransferase family protein [Clostridiales bacterium]|nr:nucleotidyltransferase family protein [Clostridiales bacterium]
MRTVGIIAEYNPFHTGHAYHIQKAKECSGADYAVAVMSPDYVQRGSPAVFDKYTRAQMALRCGADLVLELPVCYATGSAEYFAEGAVRLLDGLGVIDTLCFGVETMGRQEVSERIGTTAAPEEAAPSGMEDIRLLQAIAQIFLDEPEPYQLALREGLHRGLTFPQARERAVNLLLHEPPPDSPYENMRYLLRPSDESEDCEGGMSGLLSSPNYILGIEYCKALKKIHSGIAPLALSRRGNAYSDLSLNGEFCSARAIRQALAGGNTASLSERVRTYIPECICPLFSEASASPLFADDFLLILTQKLIYSENLETIFDFSPELARRLHRLRYQCIGKSFQEIAVLLKTKQVTEARIRRALLHLILDIRKDTVEIFRRGQGVYYAHILGFRREAVPLLHELKQKGALPLIAKTSDAPKQLTDTGRQMWSQDVAASHLYRAVRAKRYGIPFQAEQEISPVRE